MHFFCFSLSRLLILFNSCNDSSNSNEVPEEFKDRHDEYIDYLINHVNPRVKEQGIAEFVDIFCEKGVFTEDQATRYLDASSRLGFMLKIHADEFYDTGGAAVAVKTGAVSADHLLSISDENIELIAESNTVATLLPGTALFLKKPFPMPRYNYPTLHPSGFGRRTYLLF